MQTETHSKKTKKISNFINLISLCTPQSRLFIFGGGLLVAAIWPIGKISYLPLRSIYQIFGLRLYSSGLTRAMLSFMKGNFSLAYKFNPLIFPAVLIIFYIIVKDIWTLNQELRIKKYN